MSQSTRRGFLQGVLATTLLWPSAGVARSQNQQKFILILLRGGVDGLAMVPPIGDPDYRRIRGSAALSTATGTAVRLNSLFGLHAGLAPLLPMWKQKQLLLFHAVGLQGASRSHFSSQDILETGHASRHVGWLGAGLQASAKAVAIGHNVPLVLQGSKTAFSLSPKNNAYASAELTDLLPALYRTDKQLMGSLRQSIRTKSVAMQGKQGNGKSIQATARRVAKLLQREDGPQVAVIEIGGWDTHARQEQRLKSRFGQLAKGLTILQAELGSVWNQTTVLAVTEFGRTVAMNGTKGTDHGSAGAAMLLGGAINGGRVIADWPGLSRRQLYQQRDLRITTDVRAIFKGLLHDIFEIDDRLLSKQIFPHHKNVRRLRGLI